jgi:outer membrane protein assembly factor BamB
MAPGKPAAPDREGCLVKGPAFGREVAGDPAEAVWAGWRHDAARSGRTTETVPGPLQQRWARCLPGKVTPLAAGGGLVFCGSSAWALYALDAASGEVRWRYFAEGSVRVTPFLWEGRVFFGDEGGWAHCLKADTGEVVWRFRAALARERIFGYGDMMSPWPVGSGLLVRDGIAYCVAGLLPAEKVSFFALDARTGEVKREETWEPKTYFMPPVARGPMALGDQDLFFSNGGGFPWSVRFGEEKPKPVDVKGYHVKGSEIMVAGQELLAATPGLYNYVWDEPQPSNRRLPIVSANAIYMLNASIQALEFKWASLMGKGSHLVAIKPEAFELKRVHGVYYRLKKEFQTQDPANYIAWKAWKDEPMTVLIEAGGTLLSAGTGKIYATAMKDGKELWSLPVAGTVRDLAFQNGRLFALTDSGTVSCFNPQRGP